MCAAWPCSWCRDTAGWPAKLFCPAAEGQDCDPFCSNRGELRGSEGYLLGSADSGTSRVANSAVSVALAQRAMTGALAYAEQRAAFGRRILDHPLLLHQFENRLNALRSAFALAWDSVQLLNEVWMERPPYSDRYHLLRLVAHLAKYWTAEFAVDTAKWAMEVHGGWASWPSMARHAGFAKR